MVTVMSMTRQRPKAKQMGRKKKDPSEPSPTASVKIERVLASRAKIIAGHFGTDTAKYLSELLRPGIARDWAKVVKETSEGGEK
jgi:hypothetical protein